GKPTAAKGKAPATHTPGAPGVPAAGGAPGATQGSLFEGEVKVTANKATNSLIITASKSDFASMKRVIDKLDVARFQVFVEAVIMEISGKRDRTLGLTWHGGISPVIGGEPTPLLFGEQAAPRVQSTRFNTKSPSP